MRLLFLTLGLCLFASSGCASSSRYTQRPYRFDVAAPVYATTQLVAQRMANDAELRPTMTDPMRGWVVAPWRVIGATSSLRVLPPGEDTEWIVERYRAVVHPWGMSSAVMFDIERVRCDVQGFRVTDVNVWGNCRPDTTPITLETQARIDGKAAQVQNARP